MTNMIDIYEIRSDIIESYTFNKYSEISKYNQLSSIPHEILHGWYLLTLLDGKLKGFEPDETQLLKDVYEIRIKLKNEFLKLKKEVSDYEEKVTFGN